jgi:hypothetical protein
MSHLHCVLPHKLCLYDAWCSIACMNVDRHIHAFLLIRASPTTSYSDVDREKIEESSH